MKILSFLIFFPAAASLFGFIIKQRSIKTYGIIVGLIEFGVSLYLWFAYESSNPALQFVERAPLIASYGVSYFLGIDGISLFLVVLSTFMTLVAMISLSVKERLKNLIASILFLETAMVGVFASLDAIMFYIFWEFSLVPMLYIIGYWGSGNKLYAALKFFIYTFTSSLIMLFGLIFIAWIYKDTGSWSFALPDWYRLQLPLNVQMIIFFLIGIGFAVKVPMFPFHTWLPYAHGQAPTVGSILLAAVLLKMGTYAFVKFSLPILPDASAVMAIPMGILGTVMVIYAGFVAFAQTDMKQVIAYSSISHMGVIILGIFALNAEGISGSVFFMLSHGVISGALFMLVGFIYDRLHTKDIAAFGGLARTMPRYAFLFSAVLMGGIGLPLTMGFVGEFLSLLGYFKMSFIIALLAGLSIVMGAVYMLYLYKRSFFGAPKEAHGSLSDLRGFELAGVIPLVLVIVWLGVYPRPVLEPINKTSMQLVNLMYAKAGLHSTKETLVRVNTAKQGAQNEAN